jgi:hypothetical protein
MTNSVRQRPTTAGMASDAVVIAYYDAFSSLDHVFMEACIQGASKSDINSALTLFAVVKTREAYEMSNAPILITAKEWQERGGELPAPNVFGVTDMTIRYLSSDEENDSTAMYRVDYMLWSPEEYSLSRTDILTLKRDRKNNWRITDIQRTEK